MNAFNFADVFPKRVGTPNMIPSAHSAPAGVGAPYSARILLLRSWHPGTWAITVEKRDRAPGGVGLGAWRHELRVPPIWRALPRSRHESKTRRECLLWNLPRPSPWFKNFLEVAARDPACVRPPARVQRRRGGTPI